MGLGVLQDAVLQHVPGTVLFSERERHVSLQTSSPHAHLKYDRTGKTPILLVPQPSDDPNDPLNQPLWKRNLQLVLLCLMGAVSVTCSSILSTDSLTIAIHYHVGFEKVALLTGYHLLAVGLTAIFCVPSARCFGKRHLYLSGGALIIATSAWAGLSYHSYNSFLAARIVQGIGLAPFECLLNASVADLFFVHERGKRMALANLALFGGGFFAPVVVGKLSASLGWEWSFKLVAIIAGALYPLIFFFVPETAYRRTEDVAVARSAGHINLADPAFASLDSPHLGAAKGEPDAISVTELSSPAESSRAALPKRSYAESLLPFNGRKTDEDFFKILLRPFPLFCHPAVGWAVLTQGSIIGWTVFIGIVLAVVLFAPPLFFTSVQVGYMYASAIIGSICGFIFCGVLSDWSAKTMARWNNGIFEPEFRLLLVIPATIFSCGGLYAFGVTAADPGRYGWLGPELSFGFVTGGMVCATVASSLYITDAYPHLTVEAFVCCIIFKNLFAFGMAYSGYDWLVALGTRPLFIIAGSVQLGVCALTIPLYFLGKRTRSFYWRHDILKMLNLK